MSLGFYLTCLGISLAAGSTYCTLGTLLVLVPAHLFYLKYFEECELELRFGETYRAYKRNVPFMIPKIMTRKNG
jgi:protein-S-isoprenylcysteine O-methyltransferase Ste14